VSDRLSATSLKISIPWPDTITDIPTESSLEWYLRDRPAVNNADFNQMLHKFMQHCGWELHQHRGRNEIRGGLFTDMIYKTTGERGDTPMYCRAIWGSVALNPPTDNRGGFDWALYSSWDRDFDNTPDRSDINPGNGINQLTGKPSAIDDTSGWATANNTNNSVATSVQSRGPSWPAGYVGIVDFTPYGDRGDIATSYPRNYPIQNTLNTPWGGDLSENDYILLGNKDEIHIWARKENLGGASVIMMGKLKPRPEANANQWTTNFAVDNGVGPIVRIGPNDPENPPRSLPVQVGDRLQLVGQAVRAGIISGDNPSHTGEFIETGEVIGLPGNLAAIGDLECDIGANITDTNTFTIDDGQGDPNSSTIYEWDSGGGVTNVPITFTGGDSANTIRDNVIAGINPPLTLGTWTWNGTTTVTSTDTSEVAVGEWIKLISDGQMFEITSITPNVSVTLLNPDSLTIPSGGGAPAQTARALHAISASSGGAALVSLVNGRLGTSGNVVIVDTGNEFLSVRGMGGGGYGIQLDSLAEDYEAGALLGEDPQAMFMSVPTPFGSTTADPFVSTRVVRVSNRSLHNDATYHDYNSPNIDIPANDGCGFSVTFNKGGVSSFSQISPNRRTGRPGMLPLFVLDSSGIQVRGSLNLMHHIRANLVPHKVIRDRQGNFYLLVPGEWGRHSTNSVSRHVLVWGPIPETMLVVR
jgi:hypothetical protein